MEKKQKCPKCGSYNTYFDKTLGPIVGGVIVPSIGEDGYLHYPQGAHPVGKWVCLDCGHIW